MKVHAGNDNEQNNQIFIRISVEKYENGGFHGDFLVLEGNQIGNIRLIG